MKFEPLEIKNAILKELNLQIISDGQGRRFPHPGIEVQLLAVDDEDKNIYLSAFGDGKLQNEINEYLQPPLCAKVLRFIELSFVENTEDLELQKKGFLLRYIAQTPLSDKEVFLNVLEGVANRKQMKLVHKETFIGRCQKVENKYGGIERINDLYFSDARQFKGKIPKNLKDAEDINISVSRLHAHIKYIGGNYYLIDDNSSKGTFVLPEGRGASEMVDKFSGKKLDHNDLISFGKALVKIRIVEKKSDD